MINFITALHILNLYGCTEDDIYFDPDRGGYVLIDTDDMSIKHKDILKDLGYILHTHFIVLKF